MNEIQIVVDNQIKDGGETVKKISVPGGWIYIYTTKFKDYEGHPLFTSTCFVPFKQAGKAK